VLLATVLSQVGACFPSFFMMGPFRFVNYPSTRGRDITVVLDDPEHGRWLEVEAILRGYELAYGYVKGSWNGALWFNKGTAAVVEHGRIVGIVAEDFVVNLEKRRLCAKNFCAPLKYGFFPPQRRDSAIRRVRRSSI